MDDEHRGAGDWQSFEKIWTRAIVASINRVRTAEEITVGALTQRLNDGGWKVSKATVAGIVSGNKRTSISVAELCAFAWALSVPPMFLLQGFPDLRAIPDAPIWNGEEAKPSRFYEWFIGKSYPFHYPEDDLQASEDNDIGIVATIAAQGMRDVATHGELARVIQWQAAQILALAALDDEELTAAVGQRIVDQEFLWDAINHLSDARRYQRRLADEAEPGGADDWSIKLGSIPGVLAFIDRDERREDFSLEELRELAAPELIERATGNFTRIRSEIDSLRPEERNDAPS